jgi:hypothetical protein
VAGVAVLGVAVVGAIGLAGAAGSGAPSSPTPAVAAATPGATTLADPVSPAATAGAAPPIGATPTPGAYPNEAEQALLATLPAELARTCIRGATMEDARRAGWVGRFPTAYAGDPPVPVGFVDILPPPPIAGATCRPAAGATRLHVQRRALSGRSVDVSSEADEYLGFLAGRWKVPDGDCAVDAAAKQRWTSPRLTFGNVVCFRSHPYDGRPWIYFTYGGGRYLAFATRDDADYDALLAWWERLRPFLP